MIVCMDINIATHFRQDITKLYPPSKIKEEAENQKEFLVRHYVYYKHNLNTNILEYIDKKYCQ